MTEPVAEVVRGKRFELVDGEGRVRAALVLHEDGTPGLDLWDDNGNVRATLVLSREGIPRLNLLGKTGEVRAALGFGTDWRVGLVLSDPHGQVLWSAP